MSIGGPLIGNTGSKPARIQFYVSISIGGLTCFHPDEDQDAPWTAKTSLADIYTPDDAISAICIYAIVAVVFSRVATEVEGPIRR